MHGKYLQIYIHLVYKMTPLKGHLDINCLYMSVVATYIHLVYKIAYETRSVGIKFTTKKYITDMHLAYKMASETEYTLTNGCVYLYYH